MGSGNSYDKMFHDKSVRLLCYSTHTQNYVHHLHFCSFSVVFLC